MQIEYLNSMGSDRTVLNAARASFNKAQPDDAPITEKDKSLLRFLARGFDQEAWGMLKAELRDPATSPKRTEEIMWLLRTKPTHFIPFAHPQLSFRITAPLAMARQLWKAHIGVVGGDCGYAAWSESSLRYIEAEDYWLPEVWRKRADNVKQGSSDEEIVMYDDEFTVTEVLQSDSDRMMVRYKRLLELGVCPEQARLRLQVNTLVSWTWTGSLMFFARVIYQRLDADAQKETQDLVKPIAEKCGDLFPYSWEALTTGDVK